MVLFNLATVMIAATGFFGEDVLYSDIVSKETNELKPPQDVLEDLWRNPIDDTLPNFSILGYELVVFSWATLTIGIFVLSLAIGKLMGSTPTVIAAGVIGSIFLLMYKNSKQVFETMAEGLGPSAPYVVLMLSVAFLFVVLITVMDYLSGQRSTS